MAAADHCHVLFFNRLMPWDHAPGWLLHQGAGGYSAHFDTVGGLICAAGSRPLETCAGWLIGE